MTGLVEKQRYANAGSTSFNFISTQW